MRARTGLTVIGAAIMLAAPVQAQFDYPPRFVRGHGADDRADCFGDVHCAWLSRVGHSAGT